MPPRSGAFFRLDTAQLRIRVFVPENAHLLIAFALALGTKFPESRVFGNFKIEVSQNPGRSQPVGATPSDMSSFSKGGVRCSSAFAANACGVQHYAEQLLGLAAASAKTVQMRQGERRRWDTNGQRFARSRANPRFAFRA